MVTIVSQFDSPDVHHVISLGAGVQSTVVYLMAALGEIEPMPEMAIFADTQWEPKHVYAHLNWLESLALPIPITRVTAGNLYQNTWEASRVKTGRKYPFTDIPAFAMMPDGKRGMGPRQCTQKYKIEPIHQRCRELIGRKPPRPVTSAALLGPVDGDQHRRMDALQGLAARVDSERLPFDRGRYESV